MNTIVWDNREDGTVWVSTDGQSYTMPTLVGPAAEQFETHVMQWDRLVAMVLSAHELAVPQPWAMGTIRAESLGNQWAEAKDGGEGLMQITAIKHGYSDGQLKANAELNLTLGCRFLAELRVTAFDLPATASMYNAGSPCILDGRYVPCRKVPGEVPSQRPWTNEAWLANGRKAKFLSRWGFCCSPGYIDEVVKGSNYYLTRASVLAAV
jgi:hypothetical protein